jgi:hypothetical protein
MVAQRERVTLYVDKRKKKSFIKMLQLFNFVEVENQQDQLNRFIENAPPNIPLTELDISELLTDLRRTKRKQ